MAELSAIDDPTGDVGDTFNGRVVAEIYSAGRFRFTAPTASPNASTTGINVLDHGAVIGGSSTEAANNIAFSSWARAIETAIQDNGGGVVGIIPPGAYHLSQGVTFADHTTQRDGITIFGYGARINYTGTDACFSNTRPTDQTLAATTNFRNRWRYLGMSIKGLGTAGTTGIRHEAGGRGAIRDVTISDCDTGIDLAFALNWDIVGVLVGGADDCGIKLVSGTGRWSGATGPNSASNMTTVTQSKVNCAEGARAGIYVEGSGGVALRDITIEGSNPINGIEADLSTNTSAMDFEIANLHTENDPTNAHVAIAAKHRARIGFGHSTLSSNGGVAIDATGSNANSHIIVYNAVPSTGPDVNPAFTHDNCTWQFEGSHKQLRLDPENPANWTNGIVPPGIITIGHAIGSDEGRIGGHIAVTGSKASGAAFDDLLDKLEKHGIIEDLTTA